MKHYTLKQEMLKQRIDDYANIMQIIEDYQFIDSMTDYINYLLQKGKDLDPEPRERLDQLILLKVWQISTQGPSDTDDIYHTFQPIFRKETHSAQEDQDILNEKFLISRDEIVKILRDIFKLHIERFQGLLLEVEPIITVQLPSSDWNSIDIIIQKYLGGDGPDTKHEEIAAIKLKNRIQNQIEDNPLNK